MSLCIRSVVQTLFVLALFLCSRAEILYGVEVQSEAQFGYFGQRESSTGLERVGGSGLLFDIDLPQSETWGWGLKTLAHGASGDEETHIARLGAGGHVSWAFAENWRSKFGLLYVEEAMRLGLAESMQGQGHGAYIQLQHYSPIMPGVELGLGSLLLLTSTHLSYAEGSDARISPQSGAPAQSQTAMTHGVTFSLKVLL